MDLLNRLINMFIDNYDTSLISERSKVLDMETDFDIEKNLPSDEEIQRVLSEFPSRDRVSVTVEDVLENKVTYTNYETQFLSKGWDEDPQIGEQLSLRICINKEIDDDILSVYCFDSFSNEIVRKSTCDTMKMFSGLLKDRDKIVFDVYDQDINFSTKSILFRPAHQNRQRISSNRLEMLEVCEKAACFYNISEFPLVPDDFHTVLYNETNPFYKVFQKIKCILSLAYISTTAYFENEIVKIHITGQREVSYQYNTGSDEIEFGNEEIYKIFSWIYVDGNAIDKAIIARNIISLHCRFMDLLEIDAKTLASIQSNFGIYQKENAREYIALKNKLAEFILQIINDTSEIISTLADKIKYNIVGVFTFLLTVIIVNSASANPIDNIFTKEVTAIMEVFLVGSLIYLIFTWIEVNYKIKKMDKGYDMLKENYVELLDEVDQENIFKGDKMYNDNKRDLIKRRNAYSLVWVLLLIVALILIEKVSDYPIVAPFLNKMIQWISH